MKNNKSFLNSISFKTWLYFMLFALVILLVLLFSQIILLEPFYKNTLKRDITTLNSKIYDISFSEMEPDEKSARINSLAASQNACVLIFNTGSNTATAYNPLGANSCAIYADGGVNSEIIEEISQSDSKNFYKEGTIVDLNNSNIMVYGEKYQVNENMYYIISNIALQSMDNVIRTTQYQYIIIAVIILAFSILISLVFSNIISRPILNINNEASKLAKGDYNVSFDKGDINELDDLSETLQLAANELQNIDETRKELIANVSHDLKTPLTMIKAYAEMIKDISGDIEEKRNEHLDVIINETDNLNKLVSDMLDLSKLQAGAININIQPFDLSTVISNSVERFNTIVEKEGLTVKVDCEPELVAYGDEGRINEVLYNFISNALKHYGSDKQVIIKAYLLNKETIRVEIIDHGPGIDEKTLPYIWDRYFKNDRKYQRSQSGSGLGLAINKAILEDHNANFGVNTEINKGSMFYFELKAVNQDLE